MLRILFVLAGLFLTSSSFAGSSDPYDMSGSDIELVQTKLYEFNYDITQIDGKMGSETRNAIARYQTRKGHPATGIITEEEFKHLKEADTTGGAWAALSSSTDGAYFAVWSQRSRSEAARKALSGCREKSGEPAHCTTLSNAAYTSTAQGWIAAIHCLRSDDETETSYIAVASEQKRALAVEGAFDRAAEKGYPRNDCTFLTAVEARGHHK
jgi:peptidoglycan hydrolase-like protein with peptidoglycan-binding domain